MLSKTTILAVVGVVAVGGAAGATLYPRTAPAALTVPGETALMAKPSDLPPGVARARLVNILAWFVGSFVLLWLVGFREGLPVFVFFYLFFESREKWYYSLGAGILVWLALWQFFGGILHFAWARPQIAEWFGFDWPGIL